jgi:septal ring factor EnvC (AmiA/AmiB activator)
LLPSNFYCAVQTVQVPAIIQSSYQQQQQKQQQKQKKKIPQSQQKQQQKQQQLKNNNSNNNNKNNKNNRNFDLMKNLIHSAEGTSLLTFCLSKIHSLDTAYTLCQSNLG